MRLQGWKEISGYLKCGVRTAQRWEKLGLPIRQFNTAGRSPVFAFSEELDNWVGGGAPRQLAGISNSELVQRSVRLRAEVQKARKHLRARLDSLHQEIATLRNLSIKQGARVVNKVRKNEPPKLTPLSPERGRAS